MSQELTPELWFFTSWRLRLLERVHWRFCSGGGVAPNVIDVAPCARGWKMIADDGAENWFMVARCSNANLRLLDRDLENVRLASILFFLIAAHPSSADVVEVPLHSDGSVNLDAVLPSLSLSLPIH